jgi:hypothetical protein
MMCAPEDRQSTSQKSDSGENIKVILRVRPFNDTERSRGDRKVIECLDDHQTVRITGGGMEDFGRSSSTRTYTFTQVFDEQCNQQSFFEGCGVRALISQALAGYSATLFAYGQTGSGKTYSISGAEDIIADEGYSGSEGPLPQDGIVPRTVHRLYADMALAGADRRYLLKAACFEIYNEQVHAGGGRCGGPLSHRPAPLGGVKGSLPERSRARFPGLHAGRPPFRPAPPGRQGPRRAACTRAGRRHPEQAGSAWEESRGACLSLASCFGSSARGSAAPSDAA